jgi:hypothetical protein
MELSRSDLAERLWKDVEPTVFITKEQFISGLDGWDLEPVFIDGQLAILTMAKGPAFHFHSFGTGRSLTRKMICDYLRPIIAEHGYATTKTPKHDERQNRFNLLFGFSLTHEDEYDRHYRIEALPRSR